MQLNRKQQIRIETNNLCVKWISTKFKTNKKCVSKGKKYFDKIENYWEGLQGRFLLFVKGKGNILKIGKNK